MIIPSSPFRKERQPFFHGWWVVFSCFVLSFWSGSVFYGITAFINPIVKEFGWTYLAVSLAASFRSVETGLMSPILGFFVDRIGPRLAALLSGLVGGIGFVLLSQTHSLTTYYIFSIILFIGFTGLGPVVTTTVVASWFKKRIGLATGFAITGYGLGGMLLPFIAWLIDQSSWRMALMILGMSTWCVVLPVSLSLRKKPEDYGFLPDGEDPDRTAALKKESMKLFQECETTLPQALKTRTFWILSFAFTVQFLVLNGVTLHVVPYFNSLGMTVRLGALVAMFVPLSSVLGRVSLGWFGDFYNKRNFLALAFLLQAVGLAFFSCAKVLSEFIIFLACFGPAYGGALTLRSSMVREYFGRNAFGSIHGMIIAIHTLGGIIGPAFTGWVFDIHGSYRMAWFILTVATLSAVPMVLAIPSRYSKTPHVEHG